MVPLPFPQNIDCFKISIKIPGQQCDLLLAQGLISISLLMFLDTFLQQAQCFLTL